MKTAANSRGNCLTTQIKDSSGFHGSTEQLLTGTSILQVVRRQAFAEESGEPGQFRRPSGEQTFDVRILKFDLNRFRWFPYT
jgi:hypothetical protein